MKYKTYYSARKQRQPGQVIRRCGDYYILTTREEAREMNGVESGKVRMIANNSSLSISGPASEIKGLLRQAGINYTYDNNVFNIEHITWELFYRITLLFDSMEVI